MCQALCLESRVQGGRRYGSAGEENRSSCVCVWAHMHAHAGVQRVCQSRVGDERTEELMPAMVLMELEQ